MKPRGCAAHSEFLQIPDELIYRMAVLYSTRGSPAPVTGHDHQSPFRVTVLRYTQRWNSAAA